MPVERFMSSLRLENRGKLNYLGLEIGTNVLKFDDLRSPFPHGDTARRGLKFESGF